MPRRRRARKAVLFTPPKAPEPPDLDLQKARNAYMARYDDLPPSIRNALSACPFDLHIGMRNRHWNEEAMVARIAAVGSQSDAIAFNDEFAARRFGFHAFG